MFSKAKRFEPSNLKNQSKEQKKAEPEQPRPVVKPPAVASKLKFTVTPLKSKPSSDVQSQCSSVPSVASFVTPKPVTNKKIVKAPSSLKKPLQQTKKNPPGKKHEPCKPVPTEDIIKAQEAEIRNKDYTIAEYNKQIEELKIEIANLHKQMKEATQNIETTDSLNKQMSDISLNDEIDGAKTKDNSEQVDLDNNEIIQKYELKIAEIELLCEKLEQEVSSKQVELSSLEEVITIRDSLCQDLQQKLSNMETVLEETRARLEMVKGHHALALEANESIRREYKAELESLKSKFEEEKQAITSRSKTDQDAIREHYNIIIESLKLQSAKEKDEMLQDLQEQLVNKDNEMKAKLEQINEATHEKLRLCEIQFEERSRSIQEHWSQQQEKIFALEKEMKDLKYSISIAEQKNQYLQRDFDALKSECDVLKAEKESLLMETELKDETKKKFIDFENQINKLTVEVDKTSKEKHQFEMSLSVTRDIVQVLTMRLRESDNELEHLEEKVQTLTDEKAALEKEVATYKSSLNNALLECNEYKEALVNILKSKAALAKEHNRIMEHNVTLIESLQTVEKEAYRELGSIQSELIEDVEMLKKESKSQIKVLQDEVEKKRALCSLATEQAHAAATAAEQARALLAHAAAELARLDTENQRLQAQIQDQQSLVVELSLLRQENEELTMTVAKQSSVIDKLKKDAEQILTAPKSPSVMRKTHKIGKENLPAVISPLRERNH